MNTLEERLERSGYHRRVEENERDRRLVEVAKLEHEISGTPLPEKFREFEQAVNDEAATLAAEYESTVRIVDARNDLELELLAIQEKLELAAEDLDKTDPEKAARLRAMFTSDQDADDS